MKNKNLEGGRFLEYLKLHKLAKTAECFLAESAEADINPTVLTNEKIIELKNAYIEGKNDRIGRKRYFRKRIF